MRIRRARRAPGSRGRLWRRLGFLLCDAGRRLPVLEACLKALCAREKLASAFIASRTDLETLVRRYRQGRLATEGSPILEGWRGDLVGQELLAILSGRVSIHLHPHTGRVEFTPRTP